MDTDDNNHDIESNTGSSDIGDPQDKIEDLDWTDLEQRYHDKMRQLNETEQSIMSEFHGLCQVSIAYAVYNSVLTCLLVFQRLGTKWITSRSGPELQAVRKSANAACSTATDGILA